MKHQLHIAVLGICLTIGVVNPGLAVDAGFRAALDAPGRPQADKQRDAARKPAQVMAILGVDSGMTVLDVMAGGGYYTEVLSAAVGSQGVVLSQNFARALRMRGGKNLTEMNGRLARLKNVHVTLEELVDMPPPPNAPQGAAEAPPIDIDSIPLDGYRGTIDVALTALNLHDIVIYGGEDRAVSLLKSIYDALKPGGVLGVIDHVGIAGQDNTKLHRLQPSKARQLLIDAGFSVERISDVLANPADDHTLNVFNKSLGRNTDRMLIKARR